MRSAGRPPRRRGNAFPAAAAGGSHVRRTTRRAVPQRTAVPRTCRPMTSSGCATPRTDRKRSGPGEAPGDDEPLLQVVEDAVALRREKLSDRKTMTVQERVKTVKEFVATPTWIHLQRSHSLVAGSTATRRTTGRASWSESPRRKSRSPARPAKTGRPRQHLAALAEERHKGAMPIADPEMARLREGLSPALREAGGQDAR